MLVSITYNFAIIFLVENAKILSYVHYYVVALLNM